MVTQILSKIYNFRMIQPGLQVDPEVWKEIKPIDYIKISDPLQKYPDLLKHLKTSPWRKMTGQSCTKEYMDKFKDKLQSEPEEMRCTINLQRNSVKLILLTPRELSTIQLADCLMIKIPFIKDKIKKTISAENLPKQPEKPKPTQFLKSFSNYEGSLCGNVSDDDVLTEFEIEETFEMAEEWIRNGWYTPPPPPRPRPTAPKTDQPIKKKKPLRRVKFADTSCQQTANMGWPSQQDQATQTKSWQELLLKQRQDDEYYYGLFNASDTEHDSEDTLVPN